MLLQLWPNRTLPSRLLQHELHVGQITLRYAGRAPEAEATVILNGVKVEAFIDMGCGRTLVRRTKGPYTPEVLRMQCIHCDIHECRTKVVTTGIGPQTFTSRVGGVSQLDCEVLIRWDCPIRTQL